MHSVGEWCYFYELRPSRCCQMPQVPKISPNSYLGSRPGVINTDSHVNSTCGVASVYEKGGSPVSFCPNAYQCVLSSSVGASAPACFCSGAALRKKIIEICVGPLQELKICALHAQHATLISPSRRPKTSVLDFWVAF